MALYLGGQGHTLVIIARRSADASAPDCSVGRLDHASLCCVRGRGRNAAARNCRCRLAHKTNGSTKDRARQLQPRVKRHLTGSRVSESAHLTARVLHYEPACQLQIHVRRCVFYMHLFREHA
jgi:hypothetical protein